MHKRLLGLLTGRQERSAKTGSGGRLTAAAELERGVDGYVQSGNLYRLMPPDEQKRLVENIAGTLKKAPKEIQQKMVEHFSRADEAYGAGVVKGLGL